jgi:soluble lytic murein transglycosylase-like protein
MSIDPRMIKELLQLQMLNQITGRSSSKSEESTSDFSELLDSLMSGAIGSQSETDDAVQAAGGTRAAMKPLNDMYGMLGLGAFNNVSGKLNQAAQASELDPIITEASLRNGVQASLVKAVIDAESSFNSQAVSRAGAKGLMQLMDATSRGLGVTNPFDPEQNIHGGTQYLSNLLQKYDGNQGVALAAYNAGSGRMARLGIANDNELMEKLHLLPKETQNYVSKVMRLQRQYEG